MERHMRYVRGEDPSQIHIESAQSVWLTNIELSDEGDYATANIHIDETEIEQLGIYRDQAGVIDPSLPTISKFPSEYAVYFSSIEILNAIRILADQVLPPILPLGRNPATGEMVTFGTPNSEGIRRRDIEEPRRIIEADEFQIELS